MIQGYTGDYEGIQGNTGGYKGITRVLQGDYKGITRGLQGIYRGFIDYYCQYYGIAGRLYGGLPWIGRFTGS